VVGPGVWALNTQLGLILPHVDCGGQLSTSLLLSATLAAASLAAAIFSGRQRGFVAQVSGMAGALFAFTLLLQAASGALLSGCER
jgi:hypothetical protein